MSLLANHNWPKQAAFWLCFLSMGIPYWVIPYSSLSLPNGLLNIGAVVMFLAALALKGFCNTPGQDAILFTASAAPAVVTARIVVEVFLVADSHSLWPFELLIACLSGLLIGGSGAAIGVLYLRLTSSTD